MKIREFREEQAATAMRGGLAFVLTVAILFAAALWLSKLVTFPAGTIESLIFACRINVVTGVALMIAVRIVSRIRYISADDNRGSAYSPPSPRLAIPAAFLQNTLEQSVLAIIASFALASIGTESALAYMTAGAILFVIGRITFFAGYRFGAGGRAFGMVMTMTPAMGAFGWALVDWVR